MFHLNLTEKEVEYLLTVLSQRPYVEVNALMEKIRTQAQAVLNNRDNPTPKVE